MNEGEPLDSGLPILPSQGDLLKSAKSYSELLQIEKAQGDPKSFRAQYRCQQFQKPGSDLITRVYFRDDGGIDFNEKTPNDWTAWDNNGGTEI